ncbi:MAG: sulfur reduction protein DsrE [Thermodesulfatator sp.]|nr:MAG: sulfur reduction protein DsrE [Thermodesulfatator sp.]
MKWGIVISTNKAEKAWNAVRLANFALKAGDTVTIYLIGEGVEAPEIVDEPFNVRTQLEKFLGGGGKILACRTCLKNRQKKPSELHPFSSMEDLYKLILTADRIVSF